MQFDQLKRRDFISLFGNAAAAWPVAARGQQQVIRMIGWFSTRSAATDALVFPVFRQALNAQGFIEGRNVTIEYRYANAQLDRLPALAADLVGGRSPAIVIAVGDGAQVARAVHATNATMRHRRRRRP